MSHDQKPYPRYIGPYQIVGKGDGKSYIVKEMDGTILAQRVATFRLLPYISRQHEFMIKHAEEAQAETHPEETAITDKETENEVPSERSEDDLEDIYTEGT